MPVKGATGYPSSVYCIKGCGRQRQSGKERMCCRCWREAKGLPLERRGGWRSDGGRRSVGLVETITVDPTAHALAELEASGVPPDELLAPIADVPNTAAKVGTSRCRHCHYRWPQQYGLCRLCARALAAVAGYASVRQFLEADHLLREEAKLAGALRVELVPRPVSDVEADGVAYVVESSSVRPLAEGELERELAKARGGVRV